MLHRMRIVYKANLRLHGLAFVESEHARIWLALGRQIAGHAETLGLFLHLRKVGLGLVGREREDSF